MIEVEQFFSDSPWLVIPAAGVVWFGGQFTLSILVRPYRKKLADQIAVLKRIEGLSERENAMLDHVWHTAFAARSAMILTFVYVTALLMPRDAILREQRDMSASHPNFWTDPRADDLIDWYFVSVVAANPFFGIFCFVLKWAWRTKLLIIMRSRDNGDHYASLPPIEAALKV